MSGRAGAALLLLGAHLLAGCGGDGDSPFGDADALRAYRGALNPIADEVSAIEQEVRVRAVGSSNVATAANLNAVYVDVRPRLLEVLVELDRLAPPARLTALHADVRALVVLRLDAYRIVMAGFAAGDTTVYGQAEAKLRAANDLIPGINATLYQIDVALGDAVGFPVLAWRAPPPAQREGTPG